MTTSTLVKVGAVAVAALLAKTTWTAVSRRRAGQRRPPPAAPRVTPATSVGQSADAFSKNAIQHDLSIGDAV